MAEITSEILSDLLRNHLCVKRVSLVAGGPSVSDPVGEVDRYLGIVDNKGNTFHIGIDDRGNIVRWGARFGNKSYKLPIEETLK